jgi:transposase
MSTMPDVDVLVTLGVDTHADAHVAAALDHLGRELGTLSVPTTTGGFNELIEWASQFGVIDRIGVEGTGCWGAGLARWLAGEGFVVIEVDRPTRRTRRRHGKSDTIDAVAAARAVQSGEASATPKAADGDVEAIRMLRVAYRSAVKARTQAATSCTPWWSPHLMDCATSCAGCGSPSWSRSPRRCVPATSPRDQRR